MAQPQTTTQPTRRTSRLQRPLMTPSQLQAYFLARETLRRVNPTAPVPSHASRPPPTGA